MVRACFPRIEGFGRVRRRGHTKSGCASRGGRRSLLGMAEKPSRERASPSGRNQELFDGISSLTTTQRILLANSRRPPTGRSIGRMGSLVKARSLSQTAQPNSPAVSQWFLPGGASARRTLIARLMKGGHVSQIPGLRATCETLISRPVCETGTDLTGWPSWRCPTGLIKRPILSRGRRFGEVRSEAKIVRHRVRKTRSGHQAGRVQECVGVSDLCRLRSLDWRIRGHQNDGNGRELGAFFVSFVGQRYDLVRQPV